uniref:Charged multivesicular body protein 2a n=1 Tax=Parastrongyloides trichosuri TaxID=131310 RepID=A0A0N5A225_PARTI
MKALFGHKKSATEVLRENQRALNKAIRELDREKTRLEMEEQKIINEIKKMAKINQIDSVRIMAKSLVRTRGYCKKFALMKANIQTVSLKIATLKSQDAMAAAMKGVVISLRKMNNKTKLPQIQKIMMDFEKQSYTMDIKDEMLCDSIGDGFDNVDDPDETEDVINKIMDELGIELKTELNNLSEHEIKEVSNSNNHYASEKVVISDADANLCERLEKLRRNN